MNQLEYIIKNPYFLSRVDKLKQTDLLVLLNTENNPYLDEKLEAYICSKSNEHIKGLVPKVQDFWKLIDMKPSLFQYASEEQVNEDIVLDLYKDNFKGKRHLHKIVKNYLEDLFRSYDKEKTLPIAMDNPNFIHLVDLTLREQDAFIQKYIKTEPQSILNIKNLDSKFHSIALNIKPEYINKLKLSQEELLKFLAEKPQYIKYANINDETRIKLLEIDINISKHFGKKNLTPSVFEYVNKYGNISTLVQQFLSYYNDNYLRFKWSNISSNTELSNKYNLNFLFNLAQYDNKIAEIVFARYVYCTKEELDKFTHKMMKAIYANPNLIKLLPKKAIFDLFETLTDILLDRKVSKKTIKRFVYINKKRGNKEPEYSKKLTKYEEFRLLEKKFIEMFPKYVLDFPKQPKANIELAVKNNSFLKEVLSKKSVDKEDAVEKALNEFNTTDILESKKVFSRVEALALTRLTEEQILNISPSGRTSKEVMKLINKVFLTLDK